MIADGSGRFVLFRDATELHLYDRRWHRSVEILVSGEEEFDLYDGVGHALVVVTEDTRLSASVYRPTASTEPVAEGAFDGSNWRFSGDAQAWGYVPEYLVLRGNEPSLLRIADGAQKISLAEVPFVVRAFTIPDSRLVVLTGGGHVVVFDPVTARAGERFSLQRRNTSPHVDFRNSGKEMWINDVDTLLKVETANWSVVDAAGSTADDEGSETTPTEGSGHKSIVSWKISPDRSLIGVVRNDFAGALLLDPETLEPVDLLMDRYQLREVTFAAGHVLGLTPSLRVLSARIRSSRS